MLPLMSEKLLPITRLTRVAVGSVVPLAMLRVVLVGTLKRFQLAITTRD